MKKLGKYKKLDFNIIDVQYGKERITFNLMDELKITEEAINDELKAQPSYYGFLLMLHKKLTTTFETLKQRRERTWAKLYLTGKEKTSQSTNRPYTEDMAKAYADSHKDYKEITERCIRARDDADTIFSAVRAFEQRKDMLQTISSNTRKQF